MKKIFLAGVLLASTLLLFSCNKEGEGSGTNENSMKIEVSDITASSAKAVVSISGATPNLVRYVTATEAELVTVNLEDEQAVAKFATDNGSGISLPYTDAISGLQPLTDYVLAAVAYDSSMKCLGQVAVTFTTLAPENQIGDNDTAGELTERTL